MEVTCFKLVFHITVDVFEELIAFNFLKQDRPYIQRSALHDLHI